MQILRSLGIAAFALASALPASAQDGDVRLLGRVVDEPSARPVGDVHIVARNRWGAFLGQTVTDPTGRFEISVGEKTGVRLIAERVGYHRAETPFLYFDGHDFFRLEIRLAEDAVLLAPLEVVARSGVSASPMLDNFRHRMDYGFGTYLTREDIADRNPVQVTDLLRTVAGLTLSDGGSGGRRPVILGRTGCPVQVFVDGMFLTRDPANGFTIDEVVAPQDVEGIEIYRGLSTVPAEFLNEDADCGVIAIWTRRGG